MHSSSAMMSPLESLVKKPRITVRGEDELDFYLWNSSNDWAKVAGRLDQARFTSARIQLIMNKCLPAGISPTGCFLREWQQNLRLDEPVPVQTLIEVLKEMNRIDAASAVEKMLEDGTFLDYREEQPASHESLSDEGQIHTSSSGINNGAGLCLHQIHVQEETSPLTPRQDSFHAWQDGSVSRMPQTNVFSTATNFQSSARNIVPQPKNFTKSKLSLESELSTDQTTSGGSDDKRSLTWPKRNCPSCHQSSDNRSIILQNDIHPYSRPSIEPLRSVSPVHNATTGASPVPLTCGLVGDRARRPTFSGDYVFITYAQKGMRLALKLGIALKEKGLDVKIDMKRANALQCSTVEDFEKARYVVIIYDLDYIAEVRGHVQSELNTRCIYQHMEREYRADGKNIRFIPIIDLERVPPSDTSLMFQNIPLHLYEVTKFVIDVLTENFMAKKQAKEKKEVTISKTTYG